MRIPSLQHLYQKHFMLLSFIIIFLIVSTIFLILAAIDTGNYQQLIDSDSQSTPVVTNKLPDSTFRFAATGDIGSNQNAIATLKSINDNETDFTLALGDLSYGEVNESQWCELVKSQVGNKYPFELIVGNHDVRNGYVDGDIHKFAKCLPDRLNSSANYPYEYYFDYQNLARFIQISPATTIDGIDYEYIPGTKNHQWLLDTIAEARMANIPWTVVSMHKNCLTIGVKKCEISSELMDTLIEQGVDLILQGHEHTYERSKQLVLNDACKNIIPNIYNEACVIASKNGRYQAGEGSVLVIVGTGGIELREIDFTDPEINYFETWMGKNVESSYGTAIFDVSRDSINGVFVSNQPDGYTDSFEIVR